MIWYIEIILQIIFIIEISINYILLFKIIYSNALLP